MGARPKNVSAQVRAVIASLEAETFTARDLKAAKPELASLKSIGRAIHHLIWMDEVYIVRRVRFPGESYLTCIYGRGPGRSSKTQSAPMVPGVRQVRLADARHWPHDPSESRPWRGYESGLARIA